MQRFEATDVSQWVDDETLRVELLTGQAAQLRARLGAVARDAKALDGLRRRLQQVAQTRPYCDGRNGRNGRTEPLVLETVAWPVIFMDAAIEYPSVWRLAHPESVRLAQTIADWWAMAYAQEEVVFIMASLCAPSLHAAAATSPVRMQSRLFEAERALRNAGGRQVWHDALREDHARRIASTVWMPAVCLLCACIVRRPGEGAWSHPTPAPALRHRIASLLAAIVATPGAAAPRVEVLQPQSYMDATATARCWQVRHVVARVAQDTGGSLVSRIEHGQGNGGPIGTLVLSCRTACAPSPTRVEWRFDPTWMTAQQRAEMVAAAMQTGHREVLTSRIMPGEVHGHGVLQ